jgi:hypothetical protein
MADIGKFARQAAERFLESQEVIPEGFNLGLLDPAMVELVKQGIRKRFNLGLQVPAVVKFVKAVFYASMIPDEGRYPRVCLMSYRADSGREYHFPFRDPLPPTASVIAKLAHAVAPGSHLCVLSDQGKLTIGGIHVTILDPLRQFGFGSVRVANPLKLLIRGPGHIEVSTGGIALVYKTGDIFEELPLQDAAVMQPLASSVAAKLARQTTDTIESSKRVFNDLAEAIVRLGHGGLLLVSKCPNMNQFSSSRPVNCSLLGRLLVRSWHNVAALLAESGGVAKLLAQGTEPAASPHSLTVASDTTMLENCLSSIAHLAGMDGAIVMDFGCNVVAFNAMISKDAEGTDQARLVDEIGRGLAYEDVVRNRGSRHQSALAYAMRVRDSFAFIISQDGGVSAFHNRGDGTVLCERGLRALG